MMFVTRKTHEAALAAKDAELLAAGLAIVGLRSVVSVQQQTIEALADRSGELSSDLDAVTARLAKFTGPRQRGQGGRFLPVNGEVARG